MKDGGGNVTVKITKITYQDVAKNATNFLRLVIQISATDSVCGTAGKAGGHGESWGGNVTVKITKMYEEVAKNAPDFLRLVPRISFSGSVCETAGKS